MSVHLSSSKTRAFEHFRQTGNNSVKFSVVELILNSCLGVCVGGKLRHIEIDVFYLFT